MGELSEIVLLLVVCVGISAYVTLQQRQIKSVIRTLKTIATRAVIFFFGLMVVGFVITRPYPTSTHGRITVVAAFFGLVCVVFSMVLVFIKAGDKKRKPARETAVEELTTDDLVDRLHPAPNPIHKVESAWTRFKRVIGRGE